uniref:Rad21/Rec8-like protein C-terminal eukaryotic domain-containing protein n=1 Tax=Scophthalmus maximus TaxID=52904 RepID=A0A8D3AQY1_SCOMX
MLHSHLLDIRTSHVTSFSLQTLCEGNTRSQAAATFFCLLVLKKQQALQLHQSAPYQDVRASPGPTFYHQQSAS